MENIKKHLQSGEEILWSGRPHYSLINKYDLLCIPLTLFIFGSFSLLFSLYLYTQFIKNPGIASYFLTAGLFVYIISFYFLIGRFFFAKLRRNRETYVLTNKRALIFTDISDGHIDDTEFVRNKYLKVKNSIYFTSENPSVEIFYTLGLDALLKMRPKRCVAFRNLEDVEKVLGIINDSAEKEKTK